MFSHYYFNQQYFDHWRLPFGGLFSLIGGLVLIVLIVWSLVWKGMALWKAARVGHKGWFVALLIINTLGILDILYIYFFSKKPKK